MSGLSGYDSEVVGFDSVSSNTNPKATSSAQTTEYQEREVAAQTSQSRDVGCTARPDDGGAEQAPAPASPPGLHEFLRRVAPLVMEQLHQNDADFLDVSSDSDEEETLAARLIQELAVKDTGSGDHDRSILSVSWSSGGGSFAASSGQLVHDTWCRSPGPVRLYTYKRTDDGFVQSLELQEKSCVTALRYHPTVAGLLACGTAAGEVALYCGDAQRLAGPPRCHAARRVSALHWADAALANLFLLMQIKNKHKRRGAADQVLISSGYDGTINVWRVNANQSLFENIICYKLKGSGKADAPDITSIAFPKSPQLRPGGGRAAEDAFVVGSNTGRLLLCKVTEAEDPVADELDGHATCVLDVAFSPQRPEMFVSLSMDSELRVYDVNQRSALKVVSPDACLSCVCWLPGGHVAAGLVGGAELLRVYDLAGGRALAVAGLAGRGDVTCVDVTDRGLRVAAGDKDGTLRVWELPRLRNK